MNNGVEKGRSEGERQATEIARTCCITALTATVMKMTGLMEDDRADPPLTILSGAPCLAISVKRAG